VFYGLAAALGWGFADLTTAISARRIGSLLTNAVAQSAGLVALAGLMLAAGLPFRAPFPEAVFLVASGCLIGGVGYLMFYRALELGPIALVSPIVAAYAAITIVLAVVILHEALVGFALAGVVLTLVGVLLTSADVRVLRTGGGLMDGGIPLALGAMVLFGFGAFFLGRYSQPLGWSSAVLLARGGIALGVLVAAAIGRGGIPRHAGARNLGIAVAVGLGDVAGMAFFARGSEVGQVSVTSAASAAFILIPVIGGLMLFKERPAPNQILGIVVLGAGLVMLGLGGG